MRRLFIFDTTLRDGEQSLGITLNVNEKLEIANQLVKLGVDVIEAGFPASSPGDMESVRTIAREIKGVTICGLTRAVEQDINLCAEALREAESPRIHTGIGVSPVHMERKLQLKPEQVIERAVSAVKHAKKFFSDVEFYAEDAFRSDPAFLVRVIEQVIAAGASVVNIPDTVGYANPWEYGELISYVIQNVKNIDKTVVSVHCHNDLGMATANSLAGIKAGASQIEGCVNGIGERAGNTSLEEVIMAIYTRKDGYGVENQIVHKEIAATSRLVSRITGVPIPDHKAIVGSNAFMHASGIHQDGVLKERETYEIIQPETIGVPQNIISLTARSGRHALKHRLEELGYSPESYELDKVYERFLQLADEKKEILDQDLYALMGETRSHSNRYMLKNITISTNSITEASATVSLEIDDKVVTETAYAKGPVNALFHALDRLTGNEVYLEDYSIKSVTQGRESLGESTVKLRFKDGKVLVGKGLSTDILEASAKAYLNSLEKK